MTKTLGNHTSTYVLGHIETGATRSKVLHEQKAGVISQSGWARTILSFPMCGVRKRRFSREIRKMETMMTKYGLDGKKHGRDG